MKAISWCILAYPQEFIVTFPLMGNSSSIRTPLAHAVTPRIPRLVKTMTWRVVTAIWIHPHPHPRLHLLFQIEIVVNVNILYHLCLHLLLPLLVNVLYHVLYGLFLS